MYKADESPINEIRDEKYESGFRAKKLDDG